jgi:hypothetical protein
MRLLWRRCCFLAKMLQLHRLRLLRRLLQTHQSHLRTAWWQTVSWQRQQKRSDSCVLNVCILTLSSPPSHLITQNRLMLVMTICTQTNWQTVVCCASRCSVS